MQKIRLRSLDVVLEDCREEWRWRSSPSKKGFFVCIKALMKEAIKCRLTWYQRICVFSRLPQKLDSPNLPKSFLQYYNPEFPPTLLKFKYANFAITLCNFIFIVFQIPSSIGEFASSKPKTLWNCVEFPQNFRFKNAELKPWWQTLSI